MKKSKSAWKVTFGYDIEETTHAWNDLMHMKNGDTNNSLWREIMILLNPK